MTTAELIERLRQHIPAIFDHYPSDPAYLYGSAARGQAPPSAISIPPSWLAIWHARCELGLGCATCSSTLVGRSKMQ